AVNSIQVPSLLQPRSLSGPSGADQASSGSFKSFLLDSIGQVNSMQQDANRAVEQLATGGDVSPAEVFTAVQKADLAFRMMMQVRNKLVQAYQDVQNIRV
ncbi:MAG TPA: flagellar hook-basal body complex protein FliE, partial [Pirellulales bacterium]|nr:flagellar hook-basal body complex protein FliE [Pirellulales bacterium]